MGLGHVVLPATDDAAGLRFYTERARLPAARLDAAGAGDVRPAARRPPLWMRFLGCSPRHHSVALAPIPAEAGIIHLMIEVDAAGRRRPGHGPVPASTARRWSRTLGRHANDQMVSFYVRTPERLRHRVRHRRPARRRRDLGGPGDHRAQRLGTPVPARRARDGRAMTARADACSSRRRFRRVFGHFCTGVTVVTSVDAAGPAGFACQAFAAAVAGSAAGAVLPAAGSATWQRIERAGHFCVNVLAEDQRDLSRVFGDQRRGQVRGRGLVTVTGRGADPGRRADLGRLPTSRPCTRRGTTAW